MNIFFYIIIFIMGSVFGSFLTLATYRIPLNQDITHKHSYCPKCNHKLGFLDMIPILSYLFIKGRCRYCKSKISPRYFIIEILCGIAFVLLALSLKINIYELSILDLINFILGALYIVFLFLVAGIDIEHKYIDKRVLAYGFVISLLSLLFEYIYDSNFNVNRLIIYLAITVIILLFNTNQLKKKGKDSYIINFILLCIIINLFSYEVVTIYSLIITLITIIIYQLVMKIINKNKKKQENEMLPVAFCLCIYNCLTIFLANFMII